MICTYYLLEFMQVFVCVKRRHFDKQGKAFSVASRAAVYSTMFKKYALNCLHTPVEKHEILESFATFFAPLLAAPNSWTGVFN